MKKLHLFPALVAAAILLVAACNDSSNCDKNTSISNVLPDNNPVGYEVIVKTEGFTDAAKVVFGTVEAETRSGAESGDLIAKVPAGLAGNVEITVEEGDCLERFPDFVVTSAVPSLVQPSLPLIVIPSLPLSIPASINNSWANAGGSKDVNGFYEQSIFFEDNDGTTVRNLGPNSAEFDINGGFFNNNPVSGTINGTTKNITISIDRTAKTGGSVEHFEGYLINTPPSLIPKYIPVGKPVVMLLVSRETGRQLVLFTQ